MKRLLVALLLIPLLAGCSNTATPIRLEDGGQGYQAYCPTETLDWSACRKIAGDTCGSRGYEVKAQDEFRKDGGGGLLGLIFPTPTLVSRTMTFRCK